MSGKEVTLRLDWKYAADFKKVFATNTFGLLGDYDYRLVFGSADVIMQADANTAPKVQGDYKAEIVLPFRAVKELRNLLDEAVRNIELRFGEIKLPKKPEDIFRQP